MASPVADFNTSNIPTRVPQNRRLLVIYAVVIVILVVVIVMLLIAGNNKSNNPQTTNTQNNQDQSSLTADEKVEVVQTTTPSTTLTPTVQPKTTVVTTTTSTASPTPTTHVTTYALKVYFGNSTLNTSGDFAAVYNVNRSTTRSDVLTFAIEQYLAGPTAAEKSQGYFGYQGSPMFGDSSNCSGHDFRVNSIQNEVATIQFCRTVIGVGTGSDANTLAAITKTAQQFRNIQKVIILNKDGNCLFDESGLNKCLTNPGNINL
jgi:hypothetical protein